MDYISLAFLLAVLGFALIVAELFLPSGGLIAVCCVISFIVSVWFAYKGWWPTSPGLFWSFTSSLLVGIPIFLLGLFRLLETTSLGDRILLTGPKLEDVTPHAAETERLSRMVGRRGKALSMLNPGGMVQVEGERLHAFSEGVVIDPGEWVEVLEARGTRVLVRRAAAPVLPPVDLPGDVRRPETPPAELADDSQLDFDLPQS